MSMEQETLIYVEENDKAEARILSQSFAKKEIKSRAYINALGAELGMKYLALENINNSRIYNMHSVHKILEEFDISDIMLNNIHIDVRVVFDENYIFVPKSHFEYDILPDVYFVLLLAEDHSHASFLGFFEPKLINKNNQNKDYYFIEKEKLTPPSNLKTYIENFKGNTTNSLSDTENEKAEILMVSMADQNISSAEIKELLKLLQKSADLRDKFIEFENFELLAYKAEHSPYVKIPETSENDEVIDTTIDELKGSIEDEELMTGEVNELNGEQAVEDLELGEVDAEGLDENSDVSNLESAVDALNAVESSAEIAESVAAAEDSIALAAGAAAAGALAETAEIVADTAVETVQSAVAENKNNEDVAQNVETESQDELLNASIDDLPSLDMASSGEELAMDNLPELDSMPDSFDNIEDAGNSTAGDGMMTGNVSDFSDEETGMADLDQLTAKASAGNFSEASLDDLMADDTGSDSEELSSIESLQEETARQKGLLPSIDDESILESSLDFSKVEAVPQVNEADLKTGFETVDISGFDAIAPEVRLEEVSLSEDEVLDISDVETKPNNLGDNISETIEFNNIRPVNNSCENQTHKQKTAPTASLDAFGTLEPLDGANDSLFIDDLDNMDLSMDTKPAPAANNASAQKKPATPMDVDLSGFQSLDMESFSYVPLAEAQKDTSIPIEKEEEDLAKALLGDLDMSSLDSIPDFEAAPKTMQTQPEKDTAVVDNTTPHTPKGSLAEQPPGEPEMLSFDFDTAPATPKQETPVAEAPATDVSIQNEVQAQAESNDESSVSIDGLESLDSLDSVDSLSVDDIIDSPEESNVDVDLISKAVDMDVAQDTQMAEGTNSSATETASEASADDMSFEDISLDDLSQLTDGLDSNEPLQDSPAAPVSAQSAAAASSSLTGSLDELDALSAVSPANSGLNDSNNSNLGTLFNDSLNGGMSDDFVDENYTPVETSGFVPSLPHLPERQSAGKGKIIGAVIFVALLAAGTFFGLSMKNKNELADVEAISQPVPENNEAAQNNTGLPPVPGTSETTAQEDNTNLMANAPEVIDMPQNQAEPTNVKKDASKDAKVTGAKPVNPDGAVMSVKKLSWELPDYLSYSQEMKKYLQTAGRSIKLTLTSDLLLASEYAYSNQVKVSLKLSKDGSIMDSKIITSSGSKEIDDIVLQTVKQTLNVVKPAQGEVPTPDFNLGLIINF